MNQEKSEEERLADEMVFWQRKLDDDRNPNFSGRAEIVERMDEIRLKVVLDGLSTDAFLAHYERFAEERLDRE